MPGSPGPVPTRCTVGRAAVQGGCGCRERARARAERAESRECEEDEDGEGVEQVARERGRPGDESRCDWLEDRSGAGGRKARIVEDIS
jgi:hypothetical protein